MPRYMHHIKLNNFNNLQEHIKEKPCIKKRERGSGTSEINTVPKVTPNDPSF